MRMGFEFNLMLVGIMIKLAMRTQEAIVSVKSIKMTT